MRRGDFGRGTKACLQAVNAPTGNSAEAVAAGVVGHEVPGDCRLSTLLRELWVGGP